MNESEIRRRAEAFAAEAQDASARATVREWLDAARTQELRDAFEVSLTFGTAGLRAPMGIGTGRMNRVCVRRAVTALCQELETLANPAVPSATLCVGYDGRRQSAEFAEDAIRTARELGFPVHAFQRPTPTPVLAFATRHLNAAAGVMITASHNPPTDNGIKVFWRGGRQVLPPHDAEIATRLRQLDEVGARPSAQPRGPVGSLVPLGDAMVEAYLDAVRKTLPQAPSSARHPSVTYSALGGVGAEVTRRVLADLGVTEVHEVLEECRIDPAFAGLASPNPEHPAALARALSLAERTESDLALVHDPDADRLAVAVRHDGGLVRLTGDDLGVLMAEFRLSQYRGTQAAVVTTVVSSELLGAVAAAHGALHARVSTGLKWVCQRGREFEEKQGATYLFGYEEALGYCLPELGDDKDGIAALALVVLLYVHLKERDQTLVDALHGLYMAHGVHRTRQVTWDFAEEAERRRVLSTLREAPPATLAGRRLSSAESDPHTPDLTVLRYADDLRLVLRPSGTEPKLKAYLEARTQAPTPGALPAMLDAAEAALEHAARDLASLV